MCRQAGSPATSKAKVLACGAAGGIPKILWSAAPFPQINPVLKSSNFPTRRMCPHSPGHGPPRPVQAGQKRERGWGGLGGGGGGGAVHLGPSVAFSLHQDSNQVRGVPALTCSPGASLPRTLPCLCTCSPLYLGRPLKPPSRCPDVLTTPGGGGGGRKGDRHTVGRRG